MASIYAKTGECSNPPPTANPGDLYLETEWTSLPHPDKAGGGEDALLALPGWVGVADGVGGWSRRGIDAGEYSRGLMNAAEENILGGAASDHCPSALLQKAWRAVEDKRIIGSSTALIAVLNGDGVLKAANLGDSGFIYLRPTAATAAAGGGRRYFEVIHRSEEQCHGFNCPFQLGTGSSDSPAKASQWEQSVPHEGDCLILGTDGLWDNLWNGEVAEFASRSHEPGSRPLSQELALAALTRGYDPTYMSPFSTRAVAVGHKKECGGKLDDITVVVSWVARA
jgi:protein phosphatase PTC7